jgi:UDP-N-acetylglucosamine 2-epimerase (non-hydrolysing)
MNRADIVLTDSGGVQEEAPSLGKPVLIMRDTTERPEGIRAGNARLVGTKIEAIVEALQQLLDSKIVYNKMSSVVNPYGDGSSSQKIIDILGSFS